MTWGHWYWPVALTVCGLIVGGPELCALFTNTRNTLSWWVWLQLHIAHVQGFESWPAWLFFLFGGWVVIGVWMTFHFFFRLFG